MRVLIAGGGTGGHLFPGIAVAQELRRRNVDHQILFVGTERGIERDAVPKAGFNLEMLPVSGLRRVGTFGLAKGLLRLPLSLWGAARVVWRMKPDVAVSVGGYAAGPAVLAAHLFGKRSAIMEQNAIFGMTNKILSTFAHRIFAGMPIEGVDASRITLVGNPVREGLQRVRSQAYAPNKNLRVLVLGGSQGATAINDAMVDALPMFGQEQGLGLKLEMTLQTGRRDYERVRATYGAAGWATVTPFIDDMAQAYDRADLVISRAGASTLAELTVVGRPAIVVPYPFAVDDHQTKNAHALQQAGAAMILPEKNLTAKALHRMILDLSNQRDRLVAMAAASRKLGHPNAAALIVDALEIMVGDRHV